MKRRREVVWFIFSKIVHRMSFQSLPDQLAFIILASTRKGLRKIVTALCYLVSKVVEHSLDEAFAGVIFSQPISQSHPLLITAENYRFSSASYFAIICAVEFVSSAI